VSIIKRSVTLATRGVECLGALRLIERLEPDRPDLLRILTYHRIADPASDPNLYPGLISTTPEGFDAQLAWLSRTHRVISLAELLEARRRGTPLPPRALLLTFDDAYHDFAESAWPTLRRHGLPATLFVPTAFPDHPERLFWWDRLHHAFAATQRREPLDSPLGELALGTAALRSETFKRVRESVKQLTHDDAMAVADRICIALGEQLDEHRVLGWDALRELARQGVELAAHSQTHPLMNRIPPDRMRKEATGSRQDLEREVGSCLPVFAYPSGGFDHRVVQALEAEGFELAFTTRRGVNDLRSEHPLCLRRIHVGMRTTRAMLRTQLLSAVGTLQRWWLPSDASIRAPSGALQT
jgi:peptidoglycan/xylan/chitin deacetylase (PgdA/CDA1 family)